MSKRMASFFAVALFIVSNVALSKPGVVIMNGVEIQTTAPFRVSLTVTGNIRAIAQFNHSLSPNERFAYQLQDIRFERYLSNNAYIVCGPADELQALADTKQANVCDIPYQAKIDASIRVNLPQRSSGVLQPMSSKTQIVKVIFHPKTPFATAAKALIANDARLETPQAGYNFRETLDRVIVPAARIESLAREKSVLLVEEADPPIVPCNVNAQDTSNIDELHPRGISGYDLDGTGVTVGLWDPSGVRTTHSQLIGRATQVDKAHYSNFHASHVAGTIGASGQGNSLTEGMAPNVNLLCWNSSNHLAEMDANAYRIVASNHSYTTAAGWNYDEGERTWTWYGNKSFSTYASHVYGRYTSLGQSFDRIAYDRDLSIVVSAGNNRESVQTYWGTSIGEDSSLSTPNKPFADGEGDGEDDDGYDTLNTIAVGKNIITVGAIHDRLIEPPTPAEKYIAPWSSWGPTDDGRIKPDLVANGIKLLSLDSNTDKSYRPQSGTSMASPVVVGAIACLVQQYRQRFSGADPSAAVMKSLLIHTAEDGGTPPGPDYRIGWGLLDARAAADFINDIGTNGTYLEIDSFDGTPIEIPTEYTGDGPVKVTLVWTDPPGSQQLGFGNDPASNLVNDLDISITREKEEEEEDDDDEINWPWTLDPENPSGSAKRDGENHRDNVEQVYIANPSDGAYTIRIGGTVNIDASQNIALCITGLRPLQRETKLLILQPKGQYRTNDVIPIHLYSSSDVGITEVRIELNGQILDDPKTLAVDGIVQFATPQYQVNHRFQWDSANVANGRHLLSTSVTDASGQIKTREMQLFILNENTLAPLDVGETPTIGELSNYNDRDWFTVQPPESGYYAIKTQSVSGYTAPDTTLLLCGPNSQDLVIAEDDDGGEGTFSTVAQYLTADKTYYVRVGGYASSGVAKAKGLYGITLTQIAQEEAEPPIEFIASDGPALDAEFIDVGDVHWRQFTPPRLATYIIEATEAEPSPGNSFLFELFSQSNLQQAIVEGYFSKPIYRVLSPEQTYFIKASAPKSTGRYTLSLSTLSDFSSQALSIDGPAKIGEFTSGRLAEAWYVLYAKQFTSYYMEFYTESEDLAESTAFILYGPDDPARELVFTETKGSFSAKMFLPLRSSHVYYLQVLAKRGNGKFAIRVLTPKNAHPFPPPNFPLEETTAQAQTMRGNNTTDITGWRLHERE